MIHTETFPQSTSVKQLRYDEEARTLTITYNTGANYEYADVPFSIFHNAVLADSVGTYVAKEIKGKFEFKKV